MKKHYKLTPKQFDTAVKKHPKLFAGTRAAVRSVLVDGAIQIEVAEAMGMQRAQVSNAVRKVWATHLELLNVPEGWETYVATLPPEDIETVKKIEQRARAEYQKTKQAKKAGELSHARPAKKTAGTDSQRAGAVRSNASEGSAKRRK